MVSTVIKRSRLGMNMAGDFKGGKEEETLITFRLY